MCRLPRNHRRIAHRRKLRERGIGVRVQGSKAQRRSLTKGPCHFDCMCDHHEGITAHRKSRAVAKRRGLNEIKEQLR